MSAHLRVNGDVSDFTFTQARSHTALQHTTRGMTQQRQMETHTSLIHAAATAHNEHTKVKTAPSMIGTQEKRQNI